MSQQSQQTGPLVPRDDTETTVTYGIHAWVPGVQGAESLSGWWEDQATAQKAMDLAQASRPTWSARLVRRTVVKTETIEAL
jgi:hypothetical protein